MATEPRLVYADSSALAKLLVDEPETQALQAHLARAGTRLTTSRLSLVEVTRAVKMATPGGADFERFRELFDRVLLVDITADLVEGAADLVSPTLRSLDAIHLATVLHVGPDAFLAYDKRLLSGARSLGLAVVSPA